MRLSLTSPTCYCWMLLRLSVLGIPAPTFPPFKRFLLIICWSVDFGQIRDPPKFSGREYSYQEMSSHPRPTQNLVQPKSTPYKNGTTFTNGGVFRKKTQQSDFWGPQSLNHTLHDAYVKFCLTFYMVEVHSITRTEDAMTTTTIFSKDSGQFLIMHWPELRAWVKQ